MCTRRVEPGNAHTLAGITVRPLALYQKVRRPNFATWHGETTFRKQVYLPEYIRVHSSALVWSMEFKIGHIEYGSMLDGWQQ